MKMQIQALEIQDREHEKISDIIKAIPELIYELKNIGTEFKEFKNDFRTAFKDYSDKLAHITRKVEKHEYILKDRGLE